MKRNPLEALREAFAKFIEYTLVIIIMACTCGIIVYVYWCVWHFPINILGKLILSIVMSFVFYIINPFDSKKRKTPKK